jgi:hypothetical protein
MITATTNSDVERRRIVVSTADAADHLRKFGVACSVMRGVRSQSSCLKIYARGPARTLRILTEREDIKRPGN